MVAKIVTHLINQWGIIEVLANKGRKKNPSSILLDLRLFKCFWALKHLIFRVQPLLCAPYRTEWKASALPQPEQFIFGFNYTKYSKLVSLLTQWSKIRMWSLENVSVWNIQWSPEIIGYTWSFIYNLFHFETSVLLKFTDLFVSP